MATTTVEGLNVLAVNVSDLTASRSFYGEHLGFVHCEDLPPGVLLKAGDVTIYLEQTPDVPGERPPGEFSPCFATAGVKASHDALQAAGVSIATPYVEYAPTFALFRIADPDGNVIEFAGTP